MRLEREGSPRRALFHSCGWTDTRMENLYPERIVWDEKIVTICSKCKEHKILTFAVKDSLLKVRGGGSIRKIVHHALVSRDVIHTDLHSVRLKKIERVGVLLEEESKRKAGNHSPTSGRRKRRSKRNRGN